MSAGQNRIYKKESILVGAVFVPERVGCEALTDNIGVMRREELYLSRHLGGMSKSVQWWGWNDVNGGARRVSSAKLLDGLNLMWNMGSIAAAEPSATPFSSGFND